MVFENGRDLDTLSLEDVANQHKAAGIVSELLDRAEQKILEENGRWYISPISHMPNGLHFFEIRELIWNSDETVSVHASNS